MKTYYFSWIARTILLLLIVSPITYYSLQGRSSVDTGSMLDVSVSIRTLSHVRTDKYGDSVWAQGMGSGFLVSTQSCEVWTNHHVIDNATVIEVFPRGWQESHGIIAKLVNSTPHTDIAILQMESCEGMAAAKIGNSNHARVGDETYVAGNPFGKNPDSLSRGIDSHTSRYLSGPASYLQTDAAINPGNSGGALFNRDGAVIGLTTAIAANSSGNNVGIGYALPINVVLDQVASLRKGPPSWGDAGIDDLIAGLTAEEAAIFQVPDGYSAVSITRTPENGPSADKLMARDVVFKIDDKVVKSPAQVKRIIGSKKPNDIVDFYIIRNGRQEIVGIKLANGWTKFQKPEYKAEHYSGLLGMAVEMWIGQEGELGQFESPVITKIYGLGPAHLGYITSSQSLVAMRGSLPTSVQLTVNTVTGVVIEGDYKPVSDITALEQLAIKAYKYKLPLLLEIESWYRDPQYIYQPLKHSTTAFYKILPMPSDETGYRLIDLPYDWQLDDFELEVLYRA